MANELNARISVSYLAQGLSFSKTFTTTQNKTSCSHGSQVWAVTAASATQLTLSLGTIGYCLIKNNSYDYSVYLQIHASDTSYRFATLPPRGVAMWPLTSGASLYAQGTGPAEVEAILIAT